MMSRDYIQSDANPDVFSFEVDVLSLTTGTPRRITRRVIARRVSTHLGSRWRVVTPTRTLYADTLDRVADRAAEHYARQLDKKGV